MVSITTSPPSATPSHQTTFEQALARVVDIDCSMAHLSSVTSFATAGERENRFILSSYTVTLIVIAFTPPPTAVCACSFLSFFFNVLFKTALEKGKLGEPESESLQYAQVLHWIIVPGLMLIYVLSPAALLNQSAQMLKKVCSRFLVNKRNREKQYERIYKDFIDFIKYSDLHWRLGGFANSKFKYPIGWNPKK